MQDSTAKRNDTAQAAPAGTATVPAASVAAGPDKSVRRRRWPLRLGIAILVLACLYLCRVPLLQAFCRVLIVDEPGDATSVLVLGGDGCGEQAIKMFQDRSVTEILLLPGRPGRLQQMGIRRSFQSVLREELRARRLPEEAVKRIPGDVGSEWDGARCLGNWLQEHPGAEVTALCDRVASRKLRRILDTVLGPEQASRVRLRALRHRWYDETNWWQSKDGIKDTFNSYLALGHVWLNGENKQEWAAWEPEDYEKSLR